MSPVITKNISYILIFDNDIYRIFDASYHTLVL
jgi:hypothetical protein